MSMVALQAVRSTLPRALYLPVIVPTVERVERMLSGTAGRRAVLDERMRQATRLNHPYPIGLRPVTSRWTER
jgi:hypothetical protein